MLKDAEWCWVSCHRQAQSMTEPSFQSPLIHARLVVADKLKAQQKHHQSHFCCSFPATKIITHKC